MEGRKDNDYIDNDKNNKDDNEIVYKLKMLLTWTLSKRDNDNFDKNDDVD